MKKRKLLVKVLAILLALLLLGSLGLTILSALFSAQAASIDDLTAEQESIREAREALEEEQAAIAAERGSLQQSIRELNDTIDTIQAEKQLYDQMIVLSRSEIENLEQQIGLLEQQIQIKREEYEAAAAEADAQWAIFRRKLRAMEERGRITYWEVLFEDVTSFGDLLGRLDMIDEIVSQDEGVIHTMEQAKLDVALAQQALYDAKDDCELKRREQEDKQAELNRLIEESTARIRELEDEVSARQASAEELQARINELEAQIRLEEAADARIAAQIEELERLELLKNAGVTATGTYLWPSADSYYVTSLFGSRLHPILGYWRMHNGIDIGASYGTNIYASDGGVVVTSSTDASYGEYVMIAHGSGRYTLYAHMSRRLVSVDDVVSQGDVIGLVGSTGYSTGPHIHFEIREDDQRIDPLQFFSNYVVLG